MYITVTLCKHDRSVELHSQSYYHSQSPFLLVLNSNPDVSSITFTHAPHYVPYVKDGRDQTIVDYHKISNNPKQLQAEYKKFSVKMNQRA